MSEDPAEPPHLILELISAFYWFDEGLQNYMRTKGWPEVTRPQSMLLANLALGHHKPSEIARRLGVSRQAIHTTLGQMIEKGILELVDDPDDRRAKLVELSPLGEQMRRDAREAMRIMVETLEARIGKRKVAQLRPGLLADWGEPLAFDQT